MPKSGGAVQSIGGDASRIVGAGGTLYAGYNLELWAVAVGAGGTSFDAYNRRVEIPRHAPNGG